LLGLHWIRSLAGGQRRKFPHLPNIL